MRVRGVDETNRLPHRERLPTSKGKTRGDLRAGWEVGAFAEGGGGSEADQRQDAPVHHK